MYLCVCKLNWPVSSSSWSAGGGGGHDTVEGFAGAGAAGGTPTVIPWGMLLWAVKEKKLLNFMYKLNRITGSTIKASGQTQTLKHNWTNSFNIKTEPLDSHCWPLTENNSSGRTSMSGGQIPLLLNPAFMFAGVIALFHAILKTGKNSCFVMALPPTLLLNLFIWKLNSCLKAEKGFLSSGCAKWLLCASRTITLMSLSNIIFM